jgi:hypothetical protein
MNPKTLFLEALLLIGCASGPHVPEHLVATDPTPAGEPTITWTKEMGQVHVLGNSDLFPPLTMEFRTTAKDWVRYTTKVRCTITVEGLVRACVIEESVPSEDQAVLRWLGHQRYSTPLVDGVHRQLSYVFRFTFNVTPLGQDRPPD